MSLLSSFAECFHKLPRLPFTDFVRFASKKSGTSTKNTNCKVRPKHRGWKVTEGQFVRQGKLLATQYTLRFHPGLNVGIGSNKTLFAIIPGKVLITCETVKPNMEHNWMKRSYAGREGSIVYKKYFHVIPDPQHTQFKMIDQI
ncbi:mitochondrial ribosomal protein L27 [Arctopsyche grandis]|uniref:mitochondrial ribosomal protein L27 n=1 Tax=Arctopsyche grandis TaxID=121162 RepID=UPI00406D9CB7